MEEPKAAEPAAVHEAVEVREEPAQAEPEPVPAEAESPEERHARFRRFAEALMVRLDESEGVRDMLPELRAWRDDRELDRDDQRLVRNLLLTAEKRER